MDAVAKAEKTIKEIVEEAEDAELARLQIEAEYFASIASISEAPEHAEYHKAQVTAYRSWLDSQVG